MNKDTDKPSQETPLTPEQIKERNRSRLTFLAIVAVFFVPYFVIPYLFNPDEMGHTNHGTLIQPHIPITELHLIDSQGASYTDTQTRGKWSLLFFVPKTCGHACENQLFIMRQLVRGLDRDIGRVRNIMVNLYPQSEAFSQFVEKELSSFEQLNGEASIVDDVFSRLGEGNVSEKNLIFFMSPDGLIFMYYPAYDDLQEALKKAEGLRKDVKKTLKGSLIG